jgi:hypothetical protein
MSWAYAELAARLANAQTNRVWFPIGVSFTPFYYATLTGLPLLRAGGSAAGACATNPFGWLSFLRYIHFNIRARLGHVYGGGHKVNVLSQFRPLLLA